MAVFITLTISRTVNGRDVETRAYLSEYGWVQDGASTGDLGETRDLVAALWDAASEAGAFDEDEDEDA